MPWSQSLFLYTVSVIREIRSNQHTRKNRKKCIYQRLLSFTSQRSIQLLLVKLFLCVWDMGSFDIQSFSDMHTVRPKLIDVASLSLSPSPSLCFNTPLSIFLALSLSLFLLQSMSAMSPFTSEEISISSFLLKILRTVDTAFHPDVGRSFFRRQISFSCFNPNDRWRILLVSNWPLGEKKWSVCVLVLNLEFSFTLVSSLKTVWHME